MLGFTENTGFLYFIYEISTFQKKNGLLHFRRKLQTGDECKNNKYKEGMYVSKS